MTREEINALKKYTLGKKNTEKVKISVLQLNRVIKALEQQSRDNAINREDTLKAMIGQLATEVTLYKVVKNMPPVTPQSKTGHWKYDEEYSNWDYTDYKCSCCKRVVSIPYERSNEVYKEYPYCHCGAKMVEPQERSDKE